MKHKENFEHEEYEIFVQHQHHGDTARVLEARRGKNNLVELNTKRLSGLGVYRK
jgi:hypothetical protein